MSPTTRTGFLVLADITGFTPFVATTELEHSQEILQNILRSIISFLTPTFRLAEVEGDAVFVYSDRLARHDIILESIESAYFAFRDRKASLQRMRTCHCKACEMASSLDLKFVVHYGDYVMNNVGGKNKPLGSSVNMAHRLLKNHVMDATGWTAYALFTKDCLEAIQTYPEKLHEQPEEYEHIGKIQTFSINLDERYRNYISEREVFLKAEDADFVVSKDFPVTPPQLWEWLNDPKKRTLWSLGSDWKEQSRPNRSTRKGATNHCVNSNIIEKILDYRPFQYYTSSMGRGPINFTLTVKFEETSWGTRLYWHVKLEGILPKFMTRPICKLVVLKGMQIHDGFDRLLRLLEKEGDSEEVKLELPQQQQEGPKSMNVERGAVRIE
jgi:hypothetical protein